MPTGSTDPYGVTEFITQRMGDHIEILRAPERILVATDLVRDSPMIEMFVLFPGGNLYRVDNWDEDKKTFGGPKVEKPTHRFKWK